MRNESRLTRMDSLFSTSRGIRGRLEGRLTMEAPLSVFENCVPNHAELCSLLLCSLPWHRRTMQMYGKVSDIPRDEVWIGSEPYRYSGFTYPPRPWIPELLPLKAIAEQYAGVTYDSVLINRYRNGNDKVAWHCDCEETMSTDHPICSMSLGATRKFQIRPRTPKNGPITSYELASGSIVLMHAGMQQKWFHQVPSQPKVTTPRINLTFRVMTNHQRSK